jgi:hypothetical protein
MLALNQYSNMRLAARPQPIHFTKVGKLTLLDFCPFNRTPLKMELK